MKPLQIVGTIVLVCVGEVALSAQSVITKFGETQIQGRKALVHVTVVVPPGLDGNEAANNAIRGQGARPLESADYTTTGMVWPQFAGAGTAYVTQNYNRTGQPFDALVTLQAAQAWWTDVTTSNFALAMGDTNISRCPSLVKECPGPQVPDNNNDVGWLSISGCCTLAVTWYLTDGAEADMAINTRFNWGPGGYDLLAVIGHEDGHVAGLGHSSITQALMYAYYSGARNSSSPLDTDDKNGITFLYPMDTGLIQGIVGAQPGGALTGAKVSIVGSSLYALTDLSGHYEIHAPAMAGSLTLTAQANGYQSLTQSISNLTVSGATLDFSLKSSGGGGGGCKPAGPKACN